MNTQPFPAAQQRADEMVVVYGNRFNETPGDRLVEATYLDQAHEEQAAHLLAANQDAAWLGHLSNDFLRTLFIGAPPAPS